MFRRAYAKLRDPLSHLQCLLSLRQLSRSNCLASDIHSEILNTLRNEAPIDAVSEHIPKKKSILILSHEQTKNKEYVRFMDSMIKKEKWAKTSIDMKPLGDLDLFPEPLTGDATIYDVSDAIENFMPGAPDTLANFSVKLAILVLSGSFTKAQLAYYVQKCGIAHFRSKHKKVDLAETIVTKIWGADNSALNHVFAEERIPLSHQEMFLLLSQRGDILRLLKSIVTSLDFDSTNRKLILWGTQSQLLNAKINLAHRFESAVREEIDLTTIQTLSKEKYGNFSFAQVGKLIEVYFQHMQGGKYELCALNRGQVKRIQRLLVWFLDYNLHAKTSLHLPPPKLLDMCSLLPHADEYAMAWNERSKAHFQLVDETGNSVLGSLISRELNKFANETLDKAEPAMDYDVSRDYFAEAQAVDDALHALQGSETMDEDSLEHVIENIVTTSKQSEPGKSRKSRKSSLLSQEQKLQLYQELVDFNYRKDLHGVDESALDQPMFTITLGKVLFQQEKQKNSTLVSPPDKTDLSSAFTFSTNISLVYDKVLHEGFADDLDGSSFSDPHTYSLQFKFLPSPYVENAKTEDLLDNMKYPPIEMWMQLNENRVVDIESLQMVTVEGENDSYVCLPKSGCDLKVSCQMTGRLIEESVTEDDRESLSESVPNKDHTSIPVDPEDTASDMSSLFNATSSKYPRLAQQKGVQRFLESLRLNFSGKIPTSIAPFVDVMINNKQVRYSFVSANYGRELEVELDEGQMVHVSIVDGGLLGGRRVEVRFVGDSSAGLDRKAFDDLMYHTCKFVDDL